jgi:hypothetical protein
MSGLTNFEPDWGAAEDVADVEVDAARPGEEADDVDVVEAPAGRDAAIDGLPLILDDAAVGAAGTVPNDFTTLSFMGFGAAGDEDIGADASSIDPKVTGEPCFAAAAPTLLRGMLTPSLIGTDWPRALVRREWVRWLGD